MNVTAYLMGDPPPGRSALNKQHEPNRITLPSRDIGGGPPRLSTEIVQKIRESVGPSREVAVEFNVSKTAVNDIRARRTWKHV